MFESQFLGCIPHNQAHHLMQELHEKRQRNLLPDQILFLEHPPVITSGKRPAEDDLKLTRLELQQKGVDFIQTDRGGKLTYQGPGQLVIYFIFKLSSSIEKFVHQVEEGIRLLLLEEGIHTERDPENPGLWMGKSKIASIGLHVSRSITTHGAAVNFSPDLKHFDYFIPCGLPTAGVTSIKKELGKSPTVEEGAKKLKKIYEEIFL